MGFITKLWKDRQSEFPNRRTLTKEDQSTELVTVTRSEGIISEEGDAFSAENMNDLETRIKNAIGTGSIPEALGADIIAAINALNTNLLQIEIVNQSVAVSANAERTYTVQDFGVQNVKCAVLIGATGETNAAAITKCVSISSSSPYPQIILINSSVAQTIRFKFAVFHT